MNCLKCGNEVESTSHNCGVNYTNYNTVYSIPQQGWVCPTCGCVMAPWWYTCKNDHTKFDLNISDISEKKP